MKGLFIALAALALTGVVFYSMSQVSDDTKYRQAFASFKTKFNKSYGSKSEIDFRYGIFVDNMKKIESRNANPSIKYTSDVNKFTDMTFKEFSNQYLMGAKENPHHGSSTPAKLTGKSVDWRETRGAVGPVKNQGQCGSCWAFSTVASLETTRVLAGNSYVALSEQELVDCASSYGNHGCSGGLMPFAFMYIAENGITTGANYPYRGVEGRCRSSSFTERYTITDLSQLATMDVNGLMDAIDKTVVSVAIEVQDSLMFYSGGVYHATDDSCGQGLNHGVAAVGYNNQDSDPYFIVRNSWGPGWGEAGYVKMAIGEGSGTCGIANEADVYPVL